MNFMSAKLNVYIKFITSCIIFLLFVASAIAKLGPGPEWYIKAPGGEYGLISCHTEWTIVVLGPFNFTTPWNFETTRFLLFYAPGIIILGSIVFLIQYIIKRERQSPSEDIEQTNWFKHNWNYMLTGIAITIALVYCYMLPDIKDWQENKRSKELYKALQSENLDRIKTFINKENINDYFGYMEGNLYHPQPPPIFHAAASGNLKLVQYMLANSANINEPWGHSILSHVLLNCGKNKLGMIKYLIKHGANVNAINEDWKQSILFNAVENKADPAIIKLLLENGANVNLGHNSTTPFDVAPNDEIRKLLISYGAVPGKKLSSK